MEKYIKNKVVTEQISGENFKYYKFLSYEVFTDKKTGKEIKFEKNARITYTLIVNQFARLLKSGHFITDENNKYVRLDTKELAKRTNITEQTIKTKIKFLTKQNLIVVKDNLVHVPFPDVRDPRSTFVDKKGNVKLTFSLVPKYLIEHSYYKDLTENSIIYYSLTRERFIQSHINNANGSKKYVDIHGNTCCYFTNEEAQSLLGISEDTLKKDRDLLYVKGLLKSNKVNKALTYQVLEPIALPLENEVSKEEITISNDVNLANLDENLDSSFENLGLKNLKVRVEDFEKLGLSNTVLSNTSNNNTSTNDMYDMYTERVADHSQQTNQSLENDKKDNLLSSFSNTLASYLKNFVSTDIKTILGILCNTKNEFNDNYSTDYTLEDIDYKLVKMLKRVREKLSKTNETVQQATGLIKASTKKEFKQYDIDLAKEKAEVFTDHEATEHLDFAEQLKINSINALKNKNNYKAVRDSSDFEEDVLDELGVG